MQKVFDVCVCYKEYLIYVSDADYLMYVSVAKNT